MAYYPSKDVIAYNLVMVSQQHAHQAQHQFPIYWGKSMSGAVNRQVTAVVPVMAIPVTTVPRCAVPPPRIWAPQRQARDLKSQQLPCSPQVVSTRPPNRHSKRPPPVTCWVSQWYLITADPLTWRSSSLQPAGAASAPPPAALRRSSAPQPGYCARHCIPAAGSQTALQQPAGRRVALVKCDAVV